MRIEILILAITVGYMYDTYHDGKYSTLFFSYKKYYQIAFYGLMGMSVFYMFRKNPTRCRNVLYYANSMGKYLPIDQSAMHAMSPILDFTGQTGEPGTMDNINNNNNNTTPYMEPFNPKMTVSGGKIKKRSVSETKKKYIASKQKWECGGCGSQLDHTFEIDHKIRLEYGGTNDETNLIALCRNCHGRKTAQENM